MLNTGCWHESDRHALQSASDRSLAALVINSEGADCREDQGAEQPVLNYAAFASRRLDPALVNPQTMAIIPRGSGQVLDIDCQFDNGDTDPSTINWRELASPGLVANLRVPRVTDGETDPMDRAGLGARGKRGEINYAGRPYAEGNTPPGGPSLRPEDEDEDEGDDEDAFQDDEPRFLHREMLNVDTYPADHEEEMETGRLAASNPAGAQWGNRDYKPLFQVGRTFADVILEQEDEQRRRIMQNT
ncbi:MAG: hypothetical protein ABSG86_04210 [Thermoguttaceae bacterium]